VNAFIKFNVNHGKDLANIAATSAGPAADKASGPGCSPTRWKRTDSNHPPAAMNDMATSINGLSQPLAWSIRPACPICAARAGEVNGIVARPVPGPFQGRGHRFILRPKP